ncbi:MAG TPA: SGNH/GDSL hydrolase family protein [Longimicrobiaceae bacterium]|jgi:hypothetical protein
MRRSKLRALALALAGLPLLAGCRADDQEIRQIVGPQLGGDLFARYVSMGNSITAGFQSGGINDSTQIRAYPYLLAQQANASFNVPLLAKPGCPPPFIAPLGVGGSLGGATAPPCALRTNPGVPIVQNVAVPGAVIADALTATRSNDPTGTFNRLQFFFLGGQSMLQATQRAEPTLVSVWLGNNDVLGAVLAGNAAALTTEAAFTASLDGIVAGLKAIPTLQDAIVIGVVNPNVIPLVQPGAYFFLSRDAAGRFQGKPVNANCSPVTALGQPNPLAANLVSFQTVSTASITEISCANDAPLVLSADEQTTIAQRTAAFNALLQQRAQANGWIYLDPNPTLTQLANQTDAQGRYQRLRKCQTLQAAIATGSAANIQNALLRSCPVPTTGTTATFAAPNFFGSLISFDGFHPSSEAHTVVANLLINAINTKHGLTIPTI